MMFAYVLPLKAENGAGGILTPRQFQSRKLQRWPYPFLLCSRHFNPLFPLTNPQYPFYFWLSQCRTSPILYKSHQHSHSSHQPSLSLRFAGDFPVVPCLCLTLSLLCKDMRDISHAVFSVLSLCQAASASPSS